VHLNIINKKKNFFFSFLFFLLDIDRRQAGLQAEWIEAHRRREQAVADAAKQ
jgi:hypothetical protein